MLKNLKSLFVIEEEGSAKKQEKQKTPEEKKAPVSQSTPTPSINESNLGDPGQVTKKFMDVLFKAMENNNLEGFDYLEYKQSLNSLKKMPMDEATRFQSAYAMAQTMGATPAKLLKTAQHYIDILDQEEKKFENALSAQRLKQIGSKEQSIKKIEEAVKSKAEQIKKLTQEIEVQQKQAQQLKKDISLSVAKVEATKNNFIASFNALVGQIQSDMENMKNYLK